MFDSFVRKGRPLCCTRRFVMRRAKLPNRKYLSICIFVGSVQHDVNENSRAEKVKSDAPPDNIIKYEGITYIERSRSWLQLEKNLIKKQFQTQIVHHL